MIELYRHQLVQYEQALTTILSSDEERVAINTNDPYGGSVFMATAKGAGSSSVSNISADQSGECLLLLQNKFLSMSNFYNSRNTVYFTVYRVGGLTNKQERLEKWSLTDINWRRSVAVISGTLRPKENKVLELTPGNYLVEFRRSGKNYYSNAVLNPAKTMNVSHEDLVGTGYNINEINNLAAIIPK
ncbi:MAG: hypothetical protein K9M44_04440 [Candidatus Pacebacteria bacterium]|nr:hypothetical protein [Candidatus Paceibacterota bacterium]